MPANIFKLTLLAAFLCPLTTQASAIITAKEQTDLAITLYTQNLGLIQDSRSLPPLKQNETVVIRDVSKLMQTETLQIRNAGIIKGQTLSHASLNYSTLLEQHIGKDIILARSQATGQELQQTVQLLNVEGSTALVENNGRIESIPLSSEWRIIFPTDSADFLLKPSLSFRSEGTQTAGIATLSYLTQGLSWQMDYVMTLNENSSELTLDGLASLMNETGTPLKNARIRLLAGNVYQDNNPRYREKTVMLAQSMADNSRSSVPEALNDYQLYTLDEPVTLQHQQRTQVPLIQADKVNIKTLQRYSFYMGNNIDNQTHIVKPESFVRFINSQQQGLGMPLPAGQVRFFAPDATAQLHYIGSSRIKQTAQGELVELAMGKAFDVTISRKQTDFQIAYDGTVSAYEIRIRNSASSNREVELSSLFSQPWTLISSTAQPFEQNAGMARWKIKVAGNSEALLTMRVRLTKP